MEAGGMLFLLDKGRRDGGFVRDGGKMTNFRYTVWKGENLGCGVLKKLVDL